VYVVSSLEVEIPNIGLVKGFMSFCTVYSPSELFKKRDDAVETCIIRQIEHEWQPFAPLSLTFSTP